MSEQVKAIALVTGGNRGIGRAIAEEFVAAGHRVAVTVRSGEGPAGTLSVLADVTNAESLDAAFAEKLGRAIATHLDADTVAVARDIRDSGPELHAAFLAGLNSSGADVLDLGVTSTGVLYRATVDLPVDAAVAITASHNPPSYNGFKLKNHFGGPMLSDNITTVEKLIPDTFDYKSLDSIQLEESCYIDLRKYYMDYLKDKFNTELIKNSGINICYNPMFGSGQGVLNELVGADEFHSELNPSFKGISPEPIPKNLIDYHEYLASSKKYDIGVIVDGDADRIAFADGKGNYIDSHHTMLLLIYILKEYKKMDGRNYKKC